MDIPPSVLMPWETWLQRVVAESRQLLGRDWLDFFLTAPLWHFQCGAQIMGRAATGVLMPSVDGAGRYFPLTALACADAYQEWPMPDRRMDMGTEQTPLETLMLRALDADTAYDDFLAGLRALALPATPIEKNAPLFSAALVRDDETVDLPEALHGWHEREGSSAASLWWTRGGESFPPRLMAVRGLPDGALFAAMLNGNFPATPPAKAEEAV